MTAPVFAAAAGFRVAHRPSFSRQLQRGVPRQRRKPVARRHTKLQPRDRCLRDDAVVECGLDERGFELGAEHVMDAVLAKQRLIQWCVQPVRNQTGVRICPTNAIDHRDGKACGRVHRQKESDHVGFTDRLRTQLVAGQVDARDGGARVPQPCRRRREPERLATHVIRGNKQDPHTSIVWGVRGAKPLGSITLC